MKKQLCLILSLLMVLLTMAGCGSTSAGVSGGGDVKILFAVSSGGDTFREALIAAIQQAGEDQGVTVDVQYADDSVETQIQQMEAAEAAGYNAIICRPVDADTALQLEKAAGNLPVVFVNNCPSTDKLEADKYMYVGSDEVVSGTYQAEYVLDKLKDKDEINVVIMKGEKSHSATKTRTNTVKDILNASGKKVNYVFEDYADWDTELAKEYFNIFLRTGGKADCVICNNDSMAVGVVQSCKENGINPGNQLIVGVDAITDGCEAIANGDMAFTVCQSAVNQGATAVKTAVTLGSGKSAKTLEGVSDDGLNVWVDFEKVDASNVSDYM